MSLIISLQSSHQTSLHNQVFTIISQLSPLRYNFPTFISKPSYLSRRLQRLPSPDHCQMFLLCLFGVRVATERARNNLEHNNLQNDTVPTLSNKRQSRNRSQQTVPTNYSNKLSLQITPETALAIKSLQSNFRNQTITTISPLLLLYNHIDPDICDCLPSPDHCQMFLLCFFDVRVATERARTNLEHNNLQNNTVPTLSNKRQSRNRFQHTVPTNYSNKLSLQITPETTPKTSSETAQANWT